MAPKFVFLMLLRALVQTLKHEERKTKLNSGSCCQMPTCPTSQRARA